MTINKIKNRTTSKISFILNLSMDTNSILQRDLISAYCYCLNMEESVELLLNSYLSNMNIRTVALRKVCYDIRHLFKYCHRDLINKMLKSFSHLDVKGRQSAGFCLSSIALCLPVFQRRRIQNFFIQSSCIGVRRRGYKILGRGNTVPAKLLREA